MVLRLGELTPIPPFFMVGEAVLNSLQAIGIRVRMQVMERATFLTAWREKKFRGLFVVAVGTSGNAATRAEAFICSQGAFAYGGYPDIDTLCQQQAVERDRTRREALLHRIQQLTVERVMFAPIMDFRALVGLGPRIAEHALDTIPLHAFPAWEDVRLKGKTVAAASQAPRAASQAPRPPARPRAQPGSRSPQPGSRSPQPGSRSPQPGSRSPQPGPRSPQPGPAAASQAPSTSAARASGDGPGVTGAASDPSALVVLGGVVTPQRLQRSVSGYRNVPDIVGFSVQSAPQKTVNELAAAGWFWSRSLSVTTVGELTEAAQSVGVPIEIVSAPGRGFHSIVVTPRPLSDTAATALSNVFRQMPNPSPRSRRWQ